MTQPDIQTVKLNNGKEIQGMKAFKHASMRVCVCVCVCDWIICL